jgi:DNA-binding protein HU-beta
VSQQKRDLYRGLNGNVKYFNHGQRVKIMNRAELVDLISENAELTKAAASRALNALIDAVKGSLKKGDPVVLIDFGTFTIKRRAARKGRNPSTGEEINISAANVVGFKAGKALKEAVKDNKEDAKA